MPDPITDVDTLFDFLELPDAGRAAARRAAATFGLRVPRSYAERMRRGDVDDPLLRQVLPLADEDAPAPDFVEDAVGDRASAVGDGLLHKYHGRALLITTGACAVHCRYCFRRHFDYAEQHAGGSHARAALARIAADDSIAEVILSGGDPLSLSNTRLGVLGDGLDAITHVRRIRLHTRTPIVQPDRVDDGLLEWIGGRRAHCVVVVHANHPAEISPAVERALVSLRTAGAVLFNQSVLLAGVNDEADTLVALSHRLFESGVIPYYVHLPDRVCGTSHFQVNESRAVALMNAAAARLPGYLMPRFARECAGEDAKRTWGIGATRL